MAKRQPPKKSSRTRKGTSAGSQTLPIMDQPFETAIAHVRFAVKRLREAALSPIPDLDEVAPHRFDGFDELEPPPDSPNEFGKSKADAKSAQELKRQWDEFSSHVQIWSRQCEWPEKARKRVSEAFDWYETVNKRIGVTHIQNMCPRDPDWPPEKLRTELGYALVSRTGELEDNWGPPESVLGEFFEPHWPMAPQRFEPQPYQAILGHLSRNNDARAFLGMPPKRFTDPPTFTRIDRRIKWGIEPPADDNFVGPLGWYQYAEVILQQCLLERTRALELCAWCEQRIEIWESAFYPVIIIGPEITRADPKTGRPTATGRRHLKVTIAGTPAPNTADSIQAALARDLLMVRDGMGNPVELENADAQAGKLRTAIPLLAGLLTRQGDRHYSLPLAMLATSPGVPGRIRESKTWPPGAQE
jgi:hypothetical protein